MEVQNDLFYQLELYEETFHFSWLADGNGVLVGAVRLRVGVV